MLNARWLTLFAAVALLGCQGDGGAVQVSGTLKYVDGSPVTGESPLIIFEPVSDGRVANGSIQPDGTFELYTTKPGDGVQPGHYKVVLKVFKNYRDQSLAVPENYADASTTPLEATVDDDHAHFDFVVK